MTRTNNVTSVHGTPAPPCERWQCALYDDCKVNRKACDAFLIYWQTGRAPPPNIVIVERGRFGVDERSKYVVTEKPNPTHAKYVRMMKRDNYYQAKWGA